jgi:cyclic-di-GMP phosphodiesterase TipF (flagellum assembly factor)
MSQAASSWPKVAPAAGARGTQLDLATMQALIEQLATKLNQPLDESDAAAAAPRAAAREVVTSASPEAIAAALQTLVAAGARTSAATAPVGHIALVAEAVEANRIDVYLDPILGLADRKTRHFELSVRLRTETDHELTAGDYVGVAQGTGLLARIDQAKLSRAAEIARRLRLRGNSAALFSSLTGEALADDGFLAAFAALFEAEEGLGTRLVITFSQADARTFTMAHWEAIHDMAGIGLKFALEDVTDLDMDFSVLKQYGFEFIKLDASVFLEGLPAQGGRIPAADICRHLSGMGLGLIVGGIVAERELARILGFGVLLGQGALFGGPRSVALERERQQAA